jgi:hypothetical protein
MRDVKELIGIVMRVLDHAEIAEAEVLDLEFEAEGELLATLNDTYIKLLEFVHDRDLRRANPDLDRKQRSVLKSSLNTIVQLCDSDRGRPKGSPIVHRRKDRARRGAPHE